MNRDDFNILNNDIVYFDNGATALKPKILAATISDYYNNYSANAHRGDYGISLKVDVMYATAREKIRVFINAKEQSEIIFTSGTTDALNKIIFGYFRHTLQKDDEVIISKMEHASNILPWFELVDEIGIKVKYIESSEYGIDIIALEQLMTSKTKVISLAHITNVMGDIRDIKAIASLAHRKGALLVCDGAQSVPHMKVDVQDLDVDFLAFSAHKMCGPTGIGVLYGKKTLLNNIHPIIFGGGMNASFGSDGVRVYSELPELLEAGTQNIAGVIGFASIIDYLNELGMDKIERYEQELKAYAIEKLSEVKDIIIYNGNSQSGIITFNIKDVFAQDLAIYLDKYHICVRAGSHCARITKEQLGVKNTCRMSLYFYNTKEEIDYLVKVLNNPNLKSEIIL